MSQIKVAIRIPEKMKLFADREAELSGETFSAYIRRLLIQEQVKKELNHEK